MGELNTIELQSSPRTSKGLRHSMCRRRNQSKVELNQLELIRNVPTSLATSVIYWFNTGTVRYGRIEPTRTDEKRLNWYFTETRIVGKLLISSSVFIYPVHYRTCTEPVYHRGNEASGEESHQFQLVQLSQTSINRY